MYRPLYVNLLYTCIRKYFLFKTEILTIRNCRICAQPILLPMIAVSVSLTIMSIRLYHFLQKDRSQLSAKDLVIMMARG